MSEATIQLSLLHGWTSAALKTGLEEPLRDVGVLLMPVSGSGELLRVSQRGDDWLSDLLAHNQLIRRELARAVRGWASQSDPQPVQPIDGVCLVPIPVLSRRRRAGYSVAVVLTTDLLGTPAAAGGNTAPSEALMTLCRHAMSGMDGGADYQLMRTLIAQLPPSPPADAAPGGRLVKLIRYLHEQHSKLMTQEGTIESTGQQLAESYEEISLLYTITQSMTVVQQPERFVRMVCDELHSTLPYGWIGALMKDDAKRLKRLAGEFIVTGRPSSSCTGAGGLRGFARRLLAEAKPDCPVVLDDAAALVHPVSSDNRVLGIIIAGEKQGDDPAASSVDMKLLGATASHMAIFLENAALYDDLSTMFLGTLEALTASIDAKDRYTCGHSQRVAHLTQQLARAVGMDDEVVDRMHIAGLVHDVGKIGVPEQVLLKPGKLTDEEFSWVRKHPEIGYRILKDIPQLSDILPGVLHHHERWDGRGYPSGLKGAEIPRVARLIGLADAFDAMSSTRTYRKAMDRQQVLEEIERCAGKQFDPELVPHFVNLDFSEFDRLVNEHAGVGREMLGDPQGSRGGEPDAEPVIEPVRSRGAEL